MCDALTVKKVLGPSPFEMNQSHGSNQIFYKSKGVFSVTVTSFKIWNEMALYTPLDPRNKI